MMRQFFTIRPQVAPRQALEQWYVETPLGQRLKQQLIKDMTAVLDQWFGYHMLVIGLNADIPINNLTRVRRIMQVLDSQQHSREYCTGIYANDEELPIATESIDVVVVMHALDLSADQHQLLRDVHRVLTPHGHLLVVGANGLSLTGLWRRLVALWPGSRSGAAREPGPRRLEDWLKLLDFAVAPVRHKVVIPAAGNSRWARWLIGIDEWLVDHNIPLGSTYLMFADKLVRGNTKMHSFERTRARLMGLSVPNSVVGTRGSATRSPLRPVD
jgi:SAM-dependent methyltransferase